MSVQESASICVHLRTKIVSGLLSFLLLFLLILSAAVHAGQPYLVSQANLANIWRIEDTNGDGDALDLGEVITFADGVGAPVDIVALVEGLLGDYNHNGTVDAADYTVWRDALTAGSFLLNDPTPESVDETDFDYWRAHYGETLGSGAGEAASDFGELSRAAAVPEPGSVFLALLGGIMSGAFRKC